MSNNINYSNKSNYSSNNNYINNSNKFVKISSGICFYRYFVTLVDTAKCIVFHIATVRIFYGVFVLPFFSRCFSIV